MRVFGSITEGVISADRRSARLEFRDGEPVGPTTYTVGVANESGSIGGSFDVSREDWQDGTVVRAFDNCQEPSRRGLLGRKTSCSVLQELSPNRPQISHLGLKRAAALGLLALPFAGAVAGYLAGNRFENSINESHDRTAAGYERCLEAVHTRAQPGQTVVSVELGGLTPQEQADCGLYITRGARGNPPEGPSVDIPTGKLIVTDGKAQAAELDNSKIVAAASTERHHAADFDHSTTTVGALGGGAMALLMEVGVVGLAVNRDIFR
jgi:hypothetical protein